MIIAQLVSRDGDAETQLPNNAYLSETPFPGDLIATADGKNLVVIRRIFLDFGSDYTNDPRIVSVRLIVRTVK